MKCKVSTPCVNYSELRHLEILAIENAVGFFKKFKIWKDRQVRAHLILRLLSPGQVSTSYNRNETNRHTGELSTTDDQAAGWPTSLCDLQLPRCPVKSLCLFQDVPGVGVGWHLTSTGGTETQAQVSTDREEVWNIFPTSGSLSPYWKVKKVL